MSTSEEADRQRRRNSSRAGSYYNRYVTDIDWTIKRRSFCLITKFMGYNRVYRFAFAKSFCYFDPYHPVRRLAIQLIVNDFSRLFVILALVLNGVVLTFLEGDEDFLRFEVAFVALYFLVIVNRCIARGVFFQPYAYFRNPWSVVDLLITCINLSAVLCSLGYCSRTQFLSTLFAFRTLQLLNIVTFVPGMMMIVRGIKRALQMLFEVFFTSLFILSIFASIGQYVYGDALQNVCVWTSVVRHWWYGPFQYYYAIDMICGNASSAQHCPSPYVCTPSRRDYVDTNASSTTYSRSASFSTFSTSLLTVFRVMTLDEWEEVLADVISAVGLSCMVFFCCLVFLCTYFLLNLILSCITLCYEEETEFIRERDDRRIQRRLARFRNDHEFVFNVDLLDILPLRRRSKYVGKRTARGKRRSGEFRMRIVRTDTRTHRMKSALGRLWTGARTLCSEYLCQPVRRFRTAMRKAPEFPEVGEIPRPTDKRMSSYVRFCIRMAQAHARTIARTVTFHTFVVTTLMMNLVLSGLEHHGMSETLKDFSIGGDLIFTLIYFAELSFKFFAFGKHFFRDFINCIGVVVLACGLVSLYNGPEHPGYVYLSSIRALRVLELSRYWAAQKLVIFLISKTLVDVYFLLLFMILLVSVGATVGYHLFSARYAANLALLSERGQRWNFVSISSSLMMVFRILCGEWIHCLQDCLSISRAPTDATTATVCLAYFVSTYIVGSFLIMTLFLATLLKNFSSEELARERADINLRWNLKALGLFRRVRHVARSINRWSPRRLTLAVISVIRKDSSPEPHGREDLERSGFAVPATRSLTDQEEGEEERDDDPDKIVVLESVTMYGSDEEEGAHDDVVDLSEHHRLEERLVWGTYECPPQITAAYKVIHHLVVSYPSAYKMLTLLCIAVDTITLSVNDINLSRNVTVQWAVFVANIVTTTIFAVDSLLKITVFGFLGYLCNGWNVLDFVVLGASLLELAEKRRPLYVVLRCFGPIRAFSRWRGLRVVIYAIATTIPHTFNIFFVCLFFWFVFAVLGVHFFGGMFYYCVSSDNHEPVHDVLVVNKESCLSLEHLWVNKISNFDNVVNAYLSLFQIATFEGWIEIMESVMDINGVDRVPKHDHSFSPAVIYVVVFIVFVCFYLMNVFVGSIIDKFSTMKNLRGGDVVELLMTKRQKKCYRALKEFSRRPVTEYTPPMNRLRAYFYRFALSPWLECFAMFTILLYLCFILLEHLGTVTFQNYVLFHIRVVFIAFFFVEIVVKFAGLGRQFFKDPWNVFDALTFVVVVMTSFNNRSNLDLDPLAFRLIRFLKVMKFLRLDTNEKNFRAFLFALVGTVPAVINVTLLLLGVIVVYANIGMHLFKGVKYQTSINETLNFGTYVRSCLLLFQMFTGSGWNGIMLDLMIQPPDCYPDNAPGEEGSSINGNCGYPILAPIYCVSYVILTRLIITNMYVATVLNNFFVAYHEGVA